MSPRKSKSASGRGVLVQKPQSDIYTVLLILSLVAIIVGCAFLLMEIQEYEGNIKGPTAMVGWSVDRGHRTEAIGQMPMDSTAHGCFLARRQSAG